MNSELHIEDILNLTELEREIEAGYVNRRFHPLFPELAILNYSDRCQFDQAWNDVTRQTRGLIYDTLTGKVIARGFPKWFNVGDERNAPNLDPDETVEAYTKWDGSLGILYVDPKGYPRIATRGSFDSEQARHATEKLHATGEAWLYAERIESGLTPVFEIIYPDNRIVVDYGDTDALIYLGLVHTHAGTYYPANRHRVAVGTLRDIIAIPYNGDEGFILQRADGAVLKWKHDEYKELHRIVSNLTVKEVWRQLRAGTFEAFAEALPDEFHQWAKDAAEKLNDEHAYLHTDSEFWYWTLIEQSLESRKEQALWVQRTVPADRRGFVFSLLDGKDITDGVWRQVEPKGDTPARGTVDAA